MQSDHRLKDLRDALWQAMIEMKPQGKELPADPYSQPLDEVAASLAEAGAIRTDDARLVTGFLDRYDPVEGDLPPEDLPDDVDTGLCRIIAELRSLRGSGDRDIGGLGPGGGEDKVIEG